MGSLHKNTQLTLELVKAPFLVLHVSYNKYNNDFRDDIIYNIAIYADDTTFYSKCDQASELWQQLELASKLEPDLQDSVDWGRKCLVDFIAGRNQLVSFDCSNSTGATDVKMDASVLDEKSSFKMMGLPFSSRLDWDSYIIFIAKTVSKKIGVLICSMMFLFPDLICINLPYSLV